MVSPLRIGTLVSFRGGKGMIENSFEDLFGVTQYIILNQKTGRRDRVYEGEISTALTRITHDGRWNSS